ncbi:hypothetical protein K9M41_03095 [Candidatus Gracilibacteria bacterium]|nr:hypothetical protein [Candidatus Gracilibacteria bacterium]
MSYALSMFNTGQITLPKKWRDSKAKGVKKFIALEKKEGLLIKPLIIDEDHPLHDKNVELYENGDNIKIIFKKGVDPSLLIDMIKQIDGESI